MGLYMFPTCMKASAEYWWSGKFRFLLLDTGSSSLTLPSLTAARS